MFLADMVDLRAPCIAQVTILSLMANLHRDRGKLNYLTELLLYDLNRLLCVLNVLLCGASREEERNLLLIASGNFSQSCSPRTFLLNSRPENTASRYDLSINDQIIRFVNPQPVIQAQARATRSKQQYAKKDFVQEADLQIVLGEARETGESRDSLKVESTKLKGAEKKLRQ